MGRANPSPLPISPLLPELLSTLATRAGLVLIAPPGAGKTTRVPPALLDAPWLAGRRVVMLEPRRLAARAAARRMAHEHGEAVGETFGYRVRLDTMVGPTTRVEVITEGILTRRLHEDPSLEGIGCVVLDEFHERGLEGDLAFALVREVQEALRPDLRLVVMSATLDGAAVARMMNDAPVLESAGRLYPVRVRHGERPAPRALPEAMAGAITEALASETGSVLAFLPGEREIRATQAALGSRALGADVVIRPLYGALPPAEQDAALAPPPPGVRKVVLATDIAETSLTIEGIRVVVDSGLRRTPRFDPRRGLSRLETVRISQAGAEQRRGRAGRLEPGVCWRLWPEAEHRALAAQETPEILAADLAGLALDLALWGSPWGDGLCFPTPPPAGALAQARDLLTALGALDADGRPTPHAKALARLPLPPRLAHMVVVAAQDAPEKGALACLLAALLEERDRGPRRDPDLRGRVALALGERTGAAPATATATATDRRGETLARVRDTARQIARRAGVPASARPCPDAVGALLALAYPDRVALARPGGGGRFLLASGRGAGLDPHEPLAAEPCLVVADLEDAGVEGRIRLAAPLARADLDALAETHARAVEVVAWDARAEAVVARVETRWGALVLGTRDLPKAGDKAVGAAVEGIRRLGLACLPWTEEALSLRARVSFLRRALPDQGWPDLSDPVLLDTLGEWLAPFLNGVTRRGQFSRLPLGEALRDLIGRERLREVERLAPKAIVVPSGVAVGLDYQAEEGPVLAARVQQMFGWTETPCVAGGRWPVVIHLLSPAGRPLQVTRDLAGFWRTSYAAVRKEMRGRYPKHPWPEDPWNTPPTNRVKPRP